MNPDSGVPAQQDVGRVGRFERLAPCAQGGRPFSLKCNLGAVTFDYMEENSPLRLLVATALVGRSLIW